MLITLLQSNDCNGCRIDYSQSWSTVKYNTTKQQQQNKEISLIKDRYVVPLSILFFKIQARNISYWRNIMFLTKV